MQCIQRLVKALASTALLVALGACGAGMQQGVEAEAKPAPAGATTPTDHLPEVSACTGNAPAPRALRRLTQAELNNSIADIFADPAAPKTTEVFQADPVIYGFHNNYQVLTVHDFAAATLLTYGEAVGSYASTNVAKLMPTCAQPTDACRTQFLNTYGARFFRQPMTPDLVNAYLPLMQGMPTFGGGVAAAVSAMVQSPYFLYRSELGVSSGATFALTPYEIASELSYTFTASTPDAPLLQAAAQNQLRTPAQISAQASRLLLTPRGHAAAQEFFMEWLQISELGNLARMETDTLDGPTKALMLTEGRTLVDDQIFAKKGTFSSLMTTPYTFVNQPLAAFYGTPAAAPGAAFVAVPVSALHRDAGVLGLGGILSAASQSTYASPTIRGRAIRMRLLCNSLPPPPPGVPDVNATPGTPVTLREIFLSHTTSATCAACHTQMDPLGFPMGNYDTLGRRRPGDMESGQPVDTSGAVYDPVSKESTAVAGLAELGSALSTNPQSAACLARHWSMYALGSVDWPQDGCTYTAASQAAAPSGYNLQQTLIGLTQVLSFTQRSSDP